MTPKPGSQETMDLLVELLDLAHDLSAAKIKKMVDAIANNIPGYFLPCLGFGSRGLGL